MAKKKIKYIRPLMKYNPGLQRMEPDLQRMKPKLTPIPEAKEITHKSFAWVYLIILLIILIGGLILAYLLG